MSKSPSSFSLCQVRPPMCVLVVSVAKTGPVWWVEVKEARLHEVQRVAQRRPAHEVQRVVRRRPEVQRATRQRPARLGGPGDEDQSHVGGEGSPPP